MQVSYLPLPTAPGLCKPGLCGVAFILPLLGGPIGLIVLGMKGLASGRGLLEAVLPFVAELEPSLSLRGGPIGAPALALCCIGHV